MNRIVHTALSLAIAAGLSAISSLAHERYQSTSMPSKSVVKQAQVELRDEGYYRGNVDGMMGPQTRAAIRQYQHTNNLKITGRLDSSTISSLGVTTQTGQASRSMPSNQPTTNQAAPNTDQPVPNTDQSTPNTDQSSPNTDQSNPDQSN